MARPDANGWRYAPGIWYRDDGAQVERQKRGPGLFWRAQFPNGEFVVTDKETIPNDIRRPWRGFETARAAKEFLDARRREYDIETARMIRSAFADSTR